MGLFGGSSSSTQSLNNTFSFNPVINVGDENSSDASARLKGSSDATSSQKDELGLSAGVAFGGNAEGGEVSVSDDSQPMGKQKADDSSFFLGNTGLINPMYLIAAAAVGVGILIFKSKKSK
jgi:hypothetical protein